MCDGTSHRKKKPREETKTREMKCLQVWQFKEEKDVPKIKVIHWRGVVDFINNKLLLDQAALLDEDTPMKESHDDNNNNNNAVPPAIAPATTPKPPPKLNCWKQTIKSQGRSITVKIPTSHELVHRAHLKRWQRDSETLARIRSKAQSASNHSNLCAQSLFAIACASVPALALSAAQCFVPIVFFAMMADAGLFAYQKFDLKKFATSFPSDAYLRTIIQSQAGRDMLSLGHEFQQNNIPVFLSCDKGNKKGVGHLVKYLSWFDFDNMVVKKRSLDLDGSDGTSEDCAAAIKHTLLKLGHEQQLSGQTTDSGGGGVLDGLAEKLNELGLCARDYKVAACSIHGLQMQLANAVNSVIGKGGIDQQNALQMLHSVYDLQDALDSEEWRHILVRATECCHDFDDSADAADASEFVADYKKVKQLYNFEEVEVAEATAKCDNTVLVKIQAPALTRWWTVGVGACYMFKHCLPMLRACQIVINRFKSDSRANKIASGLCSMMINPDNLADLVLIKCFNTTFIRRHLDWMQSAVDLSGVPGFQSHQMAMRFFFMKQDLDAMFHQSFAGFEDYRQVVSNLDDEGKKLQETKEALFVKFSHDALNKHFPRSLSPELLPAALMSESEPATIIAAILLKDYQCIQYYERDHKFFYSEAHDRRLVIKDFCLFIHDYTKGNAVEAHTPEALKAAERVLEGWDFRFKDLSSIEDDEELKLRRHMFASCLPLASHTQFVEFGVKEAKLVAQTNRSEELRSSHAIVRSAHVTDAGNSRADATNVAMIMCRINAGLINAMTNSETMMSDDLHNSRHENVLRLLRRGHFKTIRIDLKKSLIDQNTTVDKKMNASQKMKQQQLTAAVTGHVLFGKLVQRLHMDDLKTELLFRGVEEMHYAKSYRPFELFVNENYKL